MDKKWGWEKIEVFHQIILSLPLPMQ
jgi:hypothetical protein